MSEALLASYRTLASLAGLMIVAKRSYSDTYARTARSREMVWDPPYAQQLQPGDRLLLYTDGVTEGRAADGTQFGVQRLADYIMRHSSTGLPSSEMMRWLNHAIVGYQQGALRDDATVVLIEWQPDQPGRELTP